MAFIVRITKCYYKNWEYLQASELGHKSQFGLRAYLNDLKGTSNRFSPFPHKFCPSINVDNEKAYPLFYDFKYYLLC